MSDAMRVAYLYGRTFLSADEAVRWLRANDYEEDHLHGGGRVPREFVREQSVAHVLFTEGCGEAEDRWTVVMYHGANENFIGFDFDDDEDDDDDGYER